MIEIIYLRQSDFRHCKPLSCLLLQLPNAKEVLIVPFYTLIKIRWFIRNYILNKSLLDDTKDKC